MTKEAEVQEPEIGVTIDGEAEEVIEEVLDTEADDTNTEESEDLEKEPKPNDESADSNDDEVIVTIGDQTPPQTEEHDQAPEWVRELRKAHRETQRENRELRDKVKALENPAPKAVQVGPKPKLDDFDYDTEKYEQELTAWYERKRKADDVVAEEKAAQEEAAKAWQQRLDAYGEAKSKLKVKDFDDAEAVVLETFDRTQQGIIIQGADNSALVIYALGKNPERAKVLSSIKDPVKFSHAIGKLEGSDQERINMQKRKPPLPEKKVDGTGPKSGAVDSTLGRLRAEASKTGDYSKVMAYRRKKASS